jgi:SAM-dependent methyltransferase
VGAREAPWDNAGMITSKLSRVLEPEGMETPEEVAAYDAMDHGGVNARFVEDFLATGADPSRTIDLGTGTARIPLELCAVHASATVTAVDLAAEMLTFATENIASADLSTRITTLLGDAKRTPLPDASATAVISNSLVHHVPDPLPFFVDAARLLDTGGTLFVRDLARPEDEETVRRLVALYAERDTDHQRALFEASLRAAFTVGEIRALVARAGLAGATVTMTSDRHWTLVWQRLPPTPGTRSIA